MVSREAGAWDPKFGRLFNDWKMEAVQAFLSLLDNKAIRSWSEDVLTWKGSTSKSAEQKRIPFSKQMPFFVERRKKS